MTVKSNPLQQMNEEMYITLDPEAVKTLTMRRVSPPSAATAAQFSTGRGIALMHPQSSSVVHFAAVTDAVGEGPDDLVMVIVVIVDTAAAEHFHVVETVEKRTIFD